MSEFLNIPKISAIRKRITNIKDKNTRMLFTSEYLFCGRIAELVSKKSPSQTHTKVYGIKGSAVERTVYVTPKKQKIDVAVFNVRTAKRQGIFRQVALPLDKKYEPFTEELANYYEEFNDRYLFDFTAQYAWSKARKVFEGLTYPIDSYIKKVDNKKVTILEHSHAFGTHALRHVRATELLDVFNIDPVELSLIGGWTLRSASGGISNAIERYSHIKWTKYFPKLLIEGLYD